MPPAPWRRGEFSRAPNAAAALGWQWTGRPSASGYLSRKQNVAAARLQTDWHGTARSG